MRLESFLTESHNYNIQKDFMKWAETIWGDSRHLLDQIKTGKVKILFNEDPKNRAVMSVICNPRDIRRFRSIVLSFAPKYTVVYHPRILDEDRETYEKIVKHEVLHLGLTKHDKAFRQMAKKWDTAPTQQMIKKGRAELQVRIKPRKYQTIKTFDDPDEAVMYAKYMLSDEIDRIKKKYDIDKLHLRVRY